MNDNAVLSSDVPDDVMPSKGMDGNGVMRDASVISVENKFMRSIICEPDTGNLVKISSWLEFVRPSMTRLRKSKPRPRVLLFVGPDFLLDVGWLRVKTAIPIVTIETTAYLCRANLLR